MAYQPIESYGLIGNMRTAALMGRDASIDWMCAPDFDSPSLFAAILDDVRGGRFHICPAHAANATSRQLYWPATNILVTRFLAPDGVGEVADFMALGSEEATSRALPLVRRLKVSRGRMTFRLVCEPAFDYAREPPRTTISDEGAVFEATGTAVCLGASFPLRRTQRGCEGDICLHEGESTTITLHVNPCSRRPHAMTPAEAEALFMGTVSYWRRWLAKSVYRGRWREVVERSALLLKGG